MLKWKRFCFIFLLMAECTYLPDDMAVISYVKLFTKAVEIPTTQIITYRTRLVNVAVNKPATQISTDRDYEASRAIDGIDGLWSNGGSCSNTQYESSPWWEVDILQDYFINSVAITHISKVNIQLAHDFSIVIYKDGENIGDAVLCYYHVGQATTGKTVLYMCKQKIRGRYARITVNGQPGDNNLLCLCEVRVFGTQLDRIASSYIRMEAVEISSTPDMTYSVQGYGQCAMKCYVLPMCRIFSVISMPSYYQCNIFTQENTQFVANSTGSPDTKVFLM